MFRAFAGRAGVEGIMAGSTIRIFEDFNPEEISASLSLVCRLSYSRFIGFRFAFRMLYWIIFSDMAFTSAFC